MKSLISRIKKLFSGFSSSNNSKFISQYLTEEKFLELENILGFSINKKSHYVQALMHRSFLEELTDDDDSNERLEFLGDSVLNLIVAEYLFMKFPEEDEGFLTKVRAKIVNRNSLADCAESVGLHNFLLVNQNLSNSFERGAKTILSDAFEALIGALYLDNGVEACTKFIQRVLIKPITKEGIHLIDENYKSQLLEYSQANKLNPPLYQVLKEEGPQHDRVFTVKVSVGKTLYGEGRGKNKKTAEQNAAKAALDQIA